MTRPADAPATGTLPVASPAAVRRHARRLLRQHPGALAGMLALHGTATVAGLAGPWLLGELVAGVERGITRTTVDLLALAIGGFLVVQTVLVRYARLASFRLGERVLAQLREEFVARVLALPLSTVERAGTGDLLTRTTRDVDALATSVRFAVPETLVAVVATALTVAAMVLTSPLLALPSLLLVPLLWFSTRWYLRRARTGYLWENAAYATINETLAETVDGARTVEALRLRQRRIDRSDADIRESYRAERYTLSLRTVYYPIAETAYIVPVAATLLCGGFLYAADVATLSQVTAATLYAQALVDPVDRLLSWLDRLQVGEVSLARLLGVADVPDDRTVTGDRPLDDRLAARDVRYSYVDTHDVLHGVDLAVRPGERLAIVGPSGAGKSTLGRLLAGVDAPRTGSVTLGGARLTGLPLPELRGRVALVTQEHHVFVGTVRDNVVLARADASDDEVRAALVAVDAWPWVAALPDGPASRVGSGGSPLSPAQAQQLALARLVIADPHTLVLDEATSLLDPRAARHLERSLGAVLAGRTVVAIAHRLHTAHDADRVAVVADGRIQELGSHAELVAGAGPYAALWASWHGDGTTPPPSPTVSDGIR